MSLVKEPPNVTFPEGEEPAKQYGDRLDGDSFGRHAILHWTDGKIRLERMWDGRVDLHLVGRHIRTDPAFNFLMSAMRGWRAIKAGRQVAAKYTPLPSENAWQLFLCSLAPAYYEPAKDGDHEFMLYWRDDIGTAKTDRPKLEPEIEHLPQPELPQRKIVRRILNPIPDAEPPEADSATALKHRVLKPRLVRRPLTVR